MIACDLRRTLAAAVAVSLVFAAAAPATEAPAGDAPRQLFWGDLHLHTRYSSDAALVGNIDLGPDTAYRFAKGEEVIASNGRRVRLSRPLDFVAVTDHAESMGLIPMLLQSDNPPKVVDGHLQLNRKFPSSMLARIAGSAWQLMIQTADLHDAPGEFTAFAAYEWTSTPGGNNLHRVVLFKDGADKTGKTRPLSATRAQSPAALWRHLAAYEENTGGEAIAIPHGANLSNGLMFAVESEEQHADAAWSQLRARWEPVVEVVQMKGDAEAHPSLSPTDEFADFETWDRANLYGTQAKKPEMLELEYARSALALGLRLDAELGTNPFRFGMIGGSDSHTSLSTPDEDAFWGSTARVPPSATRLQEPLIRSREGPELTTFGWEQSAAGLTAIWAEGNTRDALFGALRRREVYATSGPRIRVQLFAGWGFGPDDLARRDFAAHGGANGVPMGGVLRDAPKGGAPRLLVTAARDPDGANLDRIQIVKGWHARDGSLHETIYDVALSAGRTLGPDGKAPAVGNTVNVAEATYTNDIGEAGLQAYWRDPAFDPKAHAFYYARVLEIPTPRWTTYDAKRYGVDLPPDIAPTLQERAYTSPVWYEP